MNEIKFTQKELEQIMNALDDYVIPFVLDGVGKLDANDRDTMRTMKKDLIKIRNKIEKFN